MGKGTKIEWAGSTWNPWYGCHKVSPGCKHCYMYREMNKFGMDPTTVQRSKTKFRDPLKWTEPEVIFSCSWSDFFHAAADPWREEAWDIIRQTPQHLYLLLTKRPANIPDRLPKDWGDGWGNVMLGISAENQRYLQKRLPVVARVPSQGLFVSGEPLLGGLDFTRITLPKGYQWNALKLYNKHSTYGALKAVDWVITGGESGPDGERREVSLDWMRAIRDQCREYGVSYMTKQIDKVQPIPPDLDIQESPEQVHATVS